MSAPRMTVEIEELVLEGFPSTQHRAIASTMELELARLFTINGIPPLLSGGGTMDRIDVGQIKIGSESRKEKIGVQIAHSIYMGLNR